MDNKYLTNGGKNKFFDEEIDDDEFLRHPKSGSSGYMLPGKTPNQPNPTPSRQTSTDKMDQQRQQLADRRREIEERTLASSERGLGLLYESEKVGIATAEELARQKEQLMKTENRLDDINSTLRQSEKHIQGIRSVFSSVRNYFSGRNTALPTTGTNSGSGNMTTSTSNPTLGSGTQNSNLTGGVQSQRYVDSHPGIRNKPGVVNNPPASVDEALDRNLDDMADGLARLKGLAQGLNSELTEHNDIIDRVNDKTEVVGFKVDKQNKDMNKILGKK